MKKVGLFSFLLSAGLFLSLVSCENFISGNNFRNQLEKEIAYAKAPSFTVRVAADNGTGSIDTGAGDKSVKVSDFINLEFNVSDSYKFLYWTAIDKETGVELSDCVEFKPGNKAVTVAEILKEGNILIKPVCAIRPAVTDFSPRNNFSGEPRNSTILITFNQELSPDNDLSKISVSINGDSILQHFKEPVIEDNSIRISPDNKNPLQTFEGTKVVTVKVPFDFFYINSDGTKITLGENNFNDYVVSYIINSSTNEKTRINFQAPVTEAGTMTPTGSDNYSLGKIINLEYKERPEYKFCGWNIENGTEIVEISDAESPVTTMQVIEASTSEVKVYPKVYKRPVISSFIPDTANSAVTASVPKDSDIRIIFDHELSTQNDLSGISITINGDDISENFEKPVLEGNVITIKAKMDAPSLFSSGTRTVTVRIPSKLYYVTEDGNQVEAGTEDIQKKYIINTNSKVQAKVDFSMTADSGILSHTGTKIYNYGDEIEISFAENSSYQFLKWEVKNNISDDGKLIAEIVDTNAAKTKLKIKGKSEENRNVEIKAVCAERPYVQEFAPVVSAANPSVSKNSPINITFSKALVLTDADLAKIQITIGGDDAKKHFKNPTVSNNTVTFEADNENLIEVKSGIKTVTVTIPADFYYLANTTDDYAGDKIFTGKEIKKTYEINTKTTVVPSVTFGLVIADSGKITPSGRKEYNYGDKVDLSFEEDSKYKFLRWESSNPEKIQIENPESIETSVTIKSLEYGSFTVSAVCAERPAVTSFVPNTSTSSSASAPRDSDIEITFSKPLSDSIDLSKIQIYMDQFNVDEYFKDRNLNENKDKIILKADIDKPLQVSSGTKNITVVIPSDYSYVYKEGDKTINIPFGTAVSKTFRVNAKSKYQTTLSFSADASKGTIVPSGQQIYNYGDRISLKFEEKPEYKFLRWETNATEGIEISDEKSAETIVTVKLTDETSGLYIKPVCKLKPKLSIHFTTEHGSTVPNEDRSYYSNDKFNIRYEENPDYAFTGWKIFRNGIALDSLDNENSPLKFDSNEQKNTDVTVKNLEEDVNITLVAECAKRPKVVSYSPTLATGSVQRDRTIVVMFDKKMSVDSIYFTDKELFQAGVFRESGSGYELNNEEYILWQTGEDGDSNRKIYGYCKKSDSDGSSYVYKNIRITRRDNDSINLLKYYGEPAFDKNDTSTLRIPTKISDTDSSGNVISNGKDEAPPKNIGILVSLGASMSYKTEKDSAVSLSSEVSWPYLTNRYTDAAPPVIENSSISIVKCASNATRYQEDSDHDFKNYYYTDNTDDALLDSEGKNVCITDDVSRIKTFNVDTGHLWIKGSVSDDGSGVESVTGYFVKKYNEYYPNSKNQDEEIKEVINFELFNGSSTEIKEFDQKVNLDDFGLDEGVYTLSFSAIDANGHKTDSDCSYQFIYDVKKPDIKAFEHHRGSADKAKFLWENKITADFDKVEITTKNETKTAEDITNNFNKAQISSVSGNKDGYQVEISSLTDATNYSHTLEFYDLAGNKTVIPVEKDTFAPAVISGFSRTRNTSGETEFSWTAPSEEDFSKIKIKYQIDEEGSEDSELEKTYAKGVSLKTLTGLTDYKHYKYTATVMDYAGNESAPVTIYDDTEAPAAIVKTTISNTRNSAANETIKWTNPTTSDFGKTIIEIYDGDTLKNSYDVAKGTASQMFDELEDRKGYKYKLRTVDYSGNKSAVTEWEDIVGPSTSSLVTKSTIKNVRTSADKESLSWTNPTALENSYYIVEQYSPSGALVSTKEITRSESSKLFENMSRGKYKYRFYSVDYANNKSNSYTEWQDDVLPTATVSGISNSRTSADKETISWTNPTGAVFDDVDYMQIEQYDGTSLEKSFTWTPSSPATSKLFTSLTGGKKYTYKFSCVDYAGNKIAATTDWQDNDGPTALVTKSTISGSRPAASKETVSWANPTGDGADEVSHIIIKQYYSITGTVLNDTFTQSDKEVLSNNFTGLTNQRRYEYRFYSVDYNGNISSNYTKYEDTTGPGKVTDVYGGGRKNSKVHLYFDTPGAEDFSHVEIYRKSDSGSSYTKENISVKQLDYAASALTVINQKSKHYKVQPNSNAGTNTEYLIKAFDYAGNASEVTINQGYAQEGMVVYQHNKGTSKEEIFVSKNYYADKNPVGILYAINADVYKGRYANLVYDIKEYSGNDYVWGVYGKSPNGGDTEPHYDGLKYYNKFITNYSSTCLVTVNAYFPSTGKNANRPTVWTLLKDTINKNNTLTWYLPACDDFRIICNKKDQLNSGKSILDGKVTVTLQGGNYLGTASLYSVNQMYRIKPNSVTNGSWAYTSDDSQKDRAGICNWHFITEINLD